jgi:hypothetical protein
VPACALTAVLATVLSVNPTGLRAQEPDALCARFGEVVETGAIAAAELVEVSGMVSSRAHSGVVYAHNDAGDGATIFAMDETGGDLGPYTVTGVDPRDWEDIAVGPLPGSGRPALYLGDIGDNRAERSSVRVMRVAEPETMPDGDGGELGPTEVFRFEYPDGPADAEALIVDPRSGDVVIVTSPADGAPRIYSAAADELVDGSTITLTDEGEIASLRGSKVNAGDISPDGSFILLRTPDSVLAFARGDEPVGEALGTTPCLAPSADERSPQAIAIVGDGSGYLTSTEVADQIRRGELPPGSASRLYRVSIAEPGEVAPPPTAPETTTAPTAPPTSGAATTPTTALPGTTDPGTTDPGATSPESTDPETTSAATTAPGAPDTTEAGSAPDDSAGPAPDEDDDTPPGETDESDETGGDGETEGDGGGVPLWLLLVAAAAAAAAAAAIVVRRRRNAPLPGSAPLGPTDAVAFAAPTAANAPTEEIPVTPPPDPGSLPPPDPGGRLG